MFFVWSNFQSKEFLLPHEINYYLPVQIFICPFNNKNIGTEKYMWSVEQDIDINEMLHIAVPY